MFITAWHWLSFLPRGVRPYNLLSQRLAVIYFCRTFHVNGNECLASRWISEGKRDFFLSRKINPRESLAALRQRQQVCLYFRRLNCFKKRKLFSLSFHGTSIWIQASQWNRQDDNKKTKKKRRQQPSHEKVCSKHGTMKIDEGTFIYASCFWTGKVVQDWMEFTFERNFHRTLLRRHNQSFSITIKFQL